MMKVMVVLMFYFVNLLLLMYICVCLGFLLYGFYNWLMIVIGLDIFFLICNLCFILGYGFFVSKYIYYYRFVLFVMKVFLNRNC